MARLALRVLLLLLLFGQAPALADSEPAASPPEQIAAGVQLAAPTLEAPISIDCQPAPANQLGLVAACDIRPLTSGS